MSITPRPANRPTPAPASPEASAAASSAETRTATVAETKPATAEARPTAQSGDRVVMASGRAPAAAPSEERLLQSVSAARAARAQRADAAAGALPIGGLGLESFKSGEINARIPLASGTHKVDLGGDEAAEFKVDNGTEVRFGSKVGSGPEGPRLEGVQVSFSKPLVLKNPSALADIPLGDLGDAFVDVHITGAKIGADGRLIPEGRVKGFLIDKPLSDFVKPGDMPKLDLDLKDILAGKIKVPEGQGLADRRPIKPADLLRQLGPMIGKGDYAVKLAGEHSTLTVGDQLLTIEGKGPKDAKVQMTGSLDLDNAGRFAFTGNAQIQTQVANVQAQAQGQLGMDAKGKADASVALQSSADLKDADVVHGPTGTKATIDGSHSTEELKASANVRLQNGQTTVTNGKAAADVRASAHLDKVKIGGIEVSGQVTADLKATSDFSVDANGLHATPQVRIEPVLGQAKAKVGGLEIPVSVTGDGSAIAGSMVVQVQGNRVTVRDGAADLRLALDVKAPSVEVMGGHLSFDGKTLVTGSSRLGFDPDKGLQVDDGKVHLEAALKEGKLNANGLKLQLAEGSSLTADVKDIHVGPDGVRFSDPTAGFDLLLPGSDFQLGGLRLGLDGQLPSRLNGSTTLRIEDGRAVLPKQGEASVQFQLYGKELGGSFPGGSFQTGPGSKEFKGNAKVRFTPQQIDVLEGQLETRIELGGSVIRPS